MIRVKPASGPCHGQTSGPGPALRLAILGDSSAAGFGAPDHAGALAGRLAEALATRLGRAVSWRVSARGGATARTAAGLLPGLTDPAAGWRPEVVLIVVGVNDTTRLRRPAAFQRDVARLVVAVRDHLRSPVPVLLAGLPPMHRFPGLPAPARLLLGAHARRLDRRLAALAASAATAGLAGESPALHHLPVGDLPLDQPGLFAPDGFHPAPAAYQVWGSLLADQVAPLLV
ncbi:SGNH/GDSL hydrolase family protein [Actinoplanes sp. NEAU-A12]|uniref:SGNH/GDSL hydrolase family protein n=1 Tax=Actinoplanes sandaracinus TaxID=3045177 RepID=A0ABT6WJY8_9ACTN|nr:SGNH/GDSL hydrolase family protein [Actinoplanes sandaracinus]MDI6100044.1 SGNH/GDSL hydrolase family protein [Actinoplanes sandaracinus]